MTKDKERDDALIAEKNRLAADLERMCSGEWLAGADAKFRRIAVLLRGDEQPKPDRAEVLAGEVISAANIVSYDGYYENVYLAARFSRRHECHALAKQLQAVGHTITSRWVMPEADHVIPVGQSAQAADAERRRFAEEDCDDVRACTWMISLMQEPRDNSRGGRHIEFGMALGLGKKLTIIGPRETVFHHLTQVEHFETVDDFLATYVEEPSQ